MTIDTCMDVETFPYSLSMRTCSPSGVVPYRAVDGMVSTGVLSAMYMLRVLHMGCGHVC